MQASALPLHSPAAPRWHRCTGVPPCRSPIHPDDGGDTHRLLTDLADVIGASIAYVDRPTAEAHLERPQSNRTWAATAQQFRAMAFDDHVRDAGTLGTDWIEDVLAKAGVPGRGHMGQPVAGSPLGGA